MNKLIFFFLIILLFLSKTQNIFAYQETFTVDNIIIDVNIKQSNYKNKYINIGFRKSFQKLVTNILKSEDQNFKIPNWVGKEVTNDLRYYNMNLISFPYNKW